MRIRKYAMAWAVAASIAACGPVRAAPAGTLTKDDVRALAEIGTAAEKGDCPSVLKQAGPLVEPRRRALPNDLLASLYELMAACHLDANRLDEAHALALRGTALAESSPRLWYIRLDAERRKKLYAEVATTLEAMTGGQSAALNDIQLGWMGALVREMKDAGAAEVRTRTLKLLASDAYAPSENFGSNDGFQYLYAKDRLAAGDLESARLAIAGLEEPGSIASASLDPGMRPYLSSTDVAAAAARTLARNREWLAREPDRLRPLIAAATNLRQLGRRQEALDLLRSAEPRLEKLSDADDPDMVNWWWNELALTYESLRRPDEAAEAYRNGSKASESGLPNVSQLINLALAQNRFARPKEALATLATRDLTAGGPSPEGASPYGVMLYRQARACALHLDGRDGEAKADIDYIRSHEKDAPGAVTEIYLCLGALEAAAASAIRRLGDPELRADALLELSDFDLALPPLETDRAARNLKLLKERPDVKAAIGRAGGTRRFNVAEA